MTYETILVDQPEAGIYRITMNRPQVMNALSAQMRRELCAAFDAALLPEAAARVIILTGSAPAFCSGQDLQDAANIGASDFEHILNEEYVPLLKRITDAPVPVIAGVAGAAAGAGANLALACDVVIAAQSASFIQAFTRIGLLPDAGGTHWLPRQIGLARAMGAALFADKITAQQAEAWGMIWQAVPDEIYAQELMARARHLAHGPTAAYRAVKQAMRKSLDLDLDAALALEASLQGELGKSHDFAEGVAAFLQKRAPRYKGH